MDRCELCGKEAEVKGTSMTGAYCIGCLRLTIAECKDAIKEIQARKPGEKQHSASKKITQEEYDNALQNLMNGPLT